MSRLVVMAWSMGLSAATTGAACFMAINKIGGWGWLLAFGMCFWGSTLDAMKVKNTRPPHPMSDSIDGAIEAKTGSTLDDGAGKY